MNHPLLQPLPLQRQVGAHVLGEQARLHGNRPFVDFAGTTLTYEQADARADRAALALQALGVGKGLRVGLLLPNCLEFLDLWFGLSRIGAVQVPLNTAYKCTQILHVLRRAPVPLLVVDETLVEEVLPVLDQLPELKTLVVRGDCTRLRGRCSIQVLSYDACLAAGSGTFTGLAVSGADLGAVMNTSGTTGPSKGVQLSHAQQFILGRNIAVDMELDETDVFYNFFPLFHNTAQAMITLAVLLTGGRMVLTDRFSATTFWSDIQAHGCTAFYYIGEILHILLGTASPEPKTTIRTGWGIGASPRDFTAFQSRYAVKLRSGYGSTEANVPVFLPRNPSDPASVGRVIPGFELRIGNDHDEPLPPRHTGEILVRSTEPSAIMLGYDGDPAATVAAWRDLWFHTGDAGYFDEDGNLYFQGRIRDAIRVRGENVSAFEVEETMHEAAGIQEVAAVAVPCELGGDDIKIVVVARPGHALDPALLIAHAQQRLPKFAVPRYVQFVEALPKTETNKVKKHVLRAEPFGPGTWDRLAAHSNS